MPHVVNPIALKDDGPESKEETYMSIPGALSTRTSNPDKTWVLKFYSEAMCCPDLWCSSMDQKRVRMWEHKVWRLVERPNSARTMKNR